MILSTALALAAAPVYYFGRWTCEQKESEATVTKPAEASVLPKSSEPESKPDSVEEDVANEEPKPEEPASSPDDSPETPEEKAD